MIIKTIVVSSALAACPIQPAGPMVHALTVRAVPVRSWPEPQDRPEKTKAPHGEGSGEPPMFGGMVYAKANTASVTVSSGATGTSPYVSIPYVSVAWLPNRLPLIVSTQDFEVVQPSVAPSPQIQILTDTTKHLSNPSTMQTRRSFTRRQR